MTYSPCIYLDPAAGQAIHDAVRAGGAVPTTVAKRAEAIVWTSKEVTALHALLHPGIRWIQLPDAGIERWLSSRLFSHDRQVTCARGCYAHQVAEHALALMLACARRLPELARSHRWPDHAPHGTTLAGAAVAVIGAGGIGTALIEFLLPLGAEIIAITRGGRPVSGATTSLAAADLPRALRRARYVVLCAPATRATYQMISTDQLAMMRADAWLINVARGQLVDTTALTYAVTTGSIAGAALDVTDPEPLPTGHPFWHEPTVLITPHTGNPPDLKQAAYAARVADNVTRFVTGQPLVARIDPERGY